MNHGLLKIFWSLFFTFLTAPFLLAAGTGTGLRGFYYSWTGASPPADPFSTAPLLVRTDSTIGFNWGNGTPDASVPADHFAVRWMGYVEPLYSQTYTFYITGDDGIRVWVNGTLVVTDWSDHGSREASGTIALTAGQKYDIVLEYYENGGGAVAQLAWSSLSQAKQIIPQTQLYVNPIPTVPGNLTLSSKTATSVTLSWSASSDDLAVTGYRVYRNGVQVGGLPAGAAIAGTTFTNTGLTAETGYTYTVSAYDADGHESAQSASLYVVPRAPGTGLKGQYFHWTGTAPPTDPFSTSPVLTRLDSTVNFTWGTGSPDALVNPDLFAAKWTGQVEAPATGIYTFYTSTDDGGRLYVNGVLMNSSSWRDQGTTEWSGTINLSSNQKYDIRFEYYENGGGAVAQLSWSGPGVTKQIIPQAFLYPPTVPDPPLNVHTTNTDSASISLSWDTAWDDVGVTGYQLFRDGVQIAGLPGTALLTTSYTDTGLTDHQTYIYTVKAYDADGNVSAYSTPLSTIARTPGTGLKGYYYEWTGNAPPAAAFTGSAKMTGIAPYVYFNWGNGSPTNLTTGTPYPALNPPLTGVTPSGATVANDRFAVRFIGEVEPLVSGTYYFRTTTDDGVRLWIGNQLVVDNWTDHGTTSDTSAAMTLTAGIRYSVKMEYYENGGGAVAELFWNTPSQASGTFVPIPKENLFPPGPKPTVPTNLALLTHTQTSATLGWDPSFDDKTVTSYKIYRDGTYAGSSLTTSFTNTNLTRTNTYVYTVSAVDEDGNESDQSSPLTVSLSGETGTGLLGNYFNNMTLASPAALVRTDPSIDFNWGNGSPDALVNVDRFSVRWIGMVKTDGAGNYLFRTYSDDGVRLWINGTQVINNWTDHGSTYDYSASIALAANTKYSITMEYYENGGGAVAQLAWQKPGSTTYVVIPPTNLYPPDITAPSVPTGLSAVPGKTSVSLSWVASTDDNAVSGYEIYRSNALNGSYSLQGTSAAPSYLDTVGLITGTTYYYKVLAYDAAGNKSALSDACSATLDTTAPTAPTNLGVTGKTDKTVGLAWTASTDNTSVAGYEVWRGGVKIASTTNTLYTDVGLTVNTAYTYQVRAYDPAGNFSAYSNLVSVTTNAQSSWWNVAWGERVKITFDNSSQSEDLIHFPILVILNSSRVNYSRMQANGADLRFIDADNTTVLCHEIESWNSGGISYVWVDIPYIKAGSNNNSIWLYFGNPDAPDGQNVNGTWNSNYKTVWHLNSGFSDSTVNHDSGSNHGSADAAGEIAGGKSLNGASYITAAQNLNSWLGTSATFSAWIYTTQNGTNNAPDAPGITGVTSATEEKIFWGYLDGTSKIGLQSGSYPGSLSSASIKGHWHYIAFTRDHKTGEVKTYVDGSLNQTAFSSPGARTTSFSDIGRFAGASLNFNGTLDEVRISDKVRSADWIRAKWLTMTDAFQSFGAIETGVQKIVFTSTAQTLIQDQVSQEMDVELEDNLGNAVNAPYDIVLSLGTTSGAGSFSLSGSLPWTEIHSVAIPAGQNKAKFYYKDLLQGTPTLTVSETPSLGWTDASQQVLIGQRRLLISTSVQTLMQNQVSQMITLEAVNGSGNPVNLADDTMLELKTSSATGSFSATQDPFSKISQILLPAGHSQISFYYKDLTLGTFTLTVSETPTLSWLSATQAITIIPATDHFELSAPAKAIAGETFEMTLKAIKKTGELFTDYSGKVTLGIEYLDPATGSSLLSNPEGIVFSGGIATVKLLYPDAGTIKITAADTDSAYIKGVSGDLLFVPHHDSFTVNANQIVGKPFELDCQALNALEALTPNFGRTLNLSVIPVAPANQQGTLSATTLHFDQGLSKTTSLIFNCWGTIRIKATDPLGEGLGLSDSETAEISFHPQDFSVTLSSPPGDRKFFYPGEPLTADIKANDAQEKAIPNYLGTLGFTPLTGIKIPANYTFVSSDQGQHSFSLLAEKEGSYRISVSDTDHPSTSGQSLPLQVKYAKIMIQSKTTTVGDTQVNISLVDNKGNVIQEDSTTTLSLSLTETIPDGSASASALSAPVKIKFGMASFSLSDLQPETVTITAVSDPSLPCEEGVITFTEKSTIDLRHGGMRIEFWKEAKEDYNK